MGLRSFEKGSRELVDFIPAAASAVLWKSVECRWRLPALTPAAGFVMAGGIAAEIAEPGKNAPGDDRRLCALAAKPVA